MTREECGDDYYEKCKEIIELIELYRCKLILTGVEHTFTQGKLDKNTYYVKLFSIVIGQTGVTKSNGFEIHFHDSRIKDVHFKFLININIFVKDFNSRSIGARLRGKVKKWDKDINGNLHTYKIPFDTVEELDFIGSVFNQFLP